MATDFFDEDLLGGAETAKRSDAAARPADPAKPEAPHESDADGGRLAQQKRELTGQVAGAAREIADLQRRQDELERQKQALEELGRKQAAYETGKREIIEKLDRGVVLLEKEAARAVHMAEVLQAVRAQYSKALDELRAIDEERWPSDGFDRELTRALAVVENAVAIHGKGLAKVDGANWLRAGAMPADRASGIAPVGTAPSPRGFLHWLMVGLAVSLPLIVVIVAAFVAYIVLYGLI